jgi:TRAP-type C4-dicarboxylate transport system substrate-binding protein
MQVPILWIYNNFKYIEVFMKKNVLFYSRKCHSLFCAVLFLFCAASQVFAAPKINIKLISPMPENTAWGRMLNQIAKEWHDATAGEVTLQVYHGNPGSEIENLQKLKQGQVQAVVFSSAGLFNISDKFLTLSTPFLFQNEKELDYVLANMGGDFEQLIDDNGFQMVAWSKVGWIKFFTRNPVFVPQDLKKQNLLTGPEMPAITNAFKAMGYRVTTINFADVLTALTSGRGDGVFHIPVFVAAQQIFGIAKNMCNLNVSPIVGGIVMNQSAWHRIPDKYKDKLMQIARKVAAQNDSYKAELEASVIETMQRNGLIVNNLNDAQKAEWTAEIQKSMPILTSGKDSIADPVLYEKIKKLVAQVNN